MDANFKITSSIVNLNTSNTENNYVLDYKERNNGEAYFIIHINQNINSINFNYSTIFKTDSNLTKFECDVFDFNPTGIFILMYLNLDTINTNQSSEDQYIFRYLFV